MADYCYGCVREEFDVDYIADPHALDNDFLGFVPENQVGWALCEGCGNHLFDSTGRRYCHAKSWYEDPNDTTLFGCPECTALADLFAALFMAGVLA